ncbi:hypothetical protein OIV83_006018 [Microbotryomycetes sp. JL201]|nr:hypothetical protein OIV83_006018 [Microbotryomycetes sp. JL201]
MPVVEALHAGRRTPQAATFRIGLPAAWLAIAAVWCLTPLSWLYTIWFIATCSPALARGRPTPTTLALALQSVIFVFTTAEVIFSIIYRWMAIRANRLRPPPRYTRKFLRSVLKRSLEAGLTIEEAEHEIEQEAVAELKSRKLSEKLRRKLSGRGRRARASSSGQYELRTRVNSGGDGATTPELGKELQLASEPISSSEKSALEAVGNPIQPPAAARRERDLRIRGEDEGYRSTESLGGRSITNGFKKQYTSSFADSTLTPEDARAVDFRSWLIHWFLGTNSFEDVRRDNIAEWLAWSLYGVTLEQLEQERETWIANGKPPQQHVDGQPDEDDDGLDITQDKLGLVEHCIEMIEARAACKFDSGRNPHIKTIRLTLDPVRVTQRPLLLYTLQLIVTLKLKARGFTEIRDGDTRYLIRIPKGWKPSRQCPESHRPFMFVHGLGMGVVQYASMLSYLSSVKTLAHRPIIILVQPHISMSIFTKYHRLPPSESTCCAGIERMAKSWGFDKSGMTILSHSNGTIVHAWILRNLPHLAIRNAFADPVTFQLWEPWVCRNFLYQYKNPKEPMEYIMRYFVARELGVALLLQRHFDWSSNLLWPTEIPNVYSPWHTSIFLSSEDAILNAERMRRYLRSHGIREVRRGENVGPGRGGLKVHHGKKHGESMIGGSGLAFTQIMAWVTSEASESGLAEGDTSAAE